jgi:hypothetical protein
VDNVEGYGCRVWGIVQEYRVTLQGRHKHLRGQGHCCSGQSLQVAMTG